MAERLNKRDTGSVMAFPRIVHILVGAIAGRGSALWLHAIAPLAGLIGVWAALTVVHALVVAVTAVLAVLITTASALVAADWRADAESRRTWAQIDSAAAEFSPPVNAGTPWEIFPHYLPAADNEALRRVFRAHRFASPKPALQAIAELPAAICASRIVVASAEPILALTTPDVAPEITCHQGISTAVVSELGISDRALRKLASTISAEAPITVASRRGAAAAVHARRAAPRTRLVANAKAWSGWPARDEHLQARTPPGWHTANIIILGSSRDDRSQPLPDGSTRGNIARSTEPPSCRGPPLVVGHRSPAAETAPAKLSVKSARQAPAVGALRPADPIVRDNLGHQVPVCAAELDVIETYLDQVLREVLATVGSGRDSPNVLIGSAHCHPLVLPALTRRVRR